MQFVTPYHCVHVFTKIQHFNYNYSRPFIYALLNFCMNTQVARERIKFDKEQPGGEFVKGGGPLRVVGRRASRIEMDRNVKLSPLDPSTPYQSSAYLQAHESSGTERFLGHIRNFLNVQLHIKLQNVSYFPKYEVFV